LTRNLKPASPIINNKHYALEFFLKIYIDNFYCYLLAWMIFIIYLLLLNFDTFGLLGLFFPKSPTQPPNKPWIQHLHCFYPIVVCIPLATLVNSSNQLKVLLFFLANKSSNLIVTPNFHCRVTFQASKFVISFMILNWSLLPINLTLDSIWFPFFEFLRIFPYCTLNTNPTVFFNTLDWSIVQIEFFFFLALNSPS